jgi:hypothetical protein
MEKKEKEAVGYGNCIPLFEKQQSQEARDLTQSGDPSSLHIA